MSSNENVTSLGPVAYAVLKHELEALQIKLDQALRMSEPADTKVVAGLQAKPRERDVAGLQAKLEERNMQMKRLKEDQLSHLKRLKKMKEDQLSQLKRLKKTKEDQLSQEVSDTKAGGGKSCGETEGRESLKSSGG